MENKKNYNLIIGLIAIIAIVALVRFLGSSPSVTVDKVDNGNQVAVESTEDTTTGSVDVSAPKPTITYAQALVKYKDARIQLDTACQASPNNVTYKNNTSIMIDNRSSVARTIKVGSVLPIKAWGFKIIKLSSSNLPATWLIDCGVSQNVATVLIQK